MSPTTQTCGLSGTVRSGNTFTRPARSISAPDCAARSRPSGLAATPADHTLRGRIRCGLMLPSLYFTVMPLRSTSVTMAPSWISTPIFSSRSFAFSAELLTHRRQYRGRGVDQDHPRLGRVDVPERTLERVVGEFLRSARPSRHRSGPAPTTTNVSSFFRRTGIAGPLGLLERAEDPAAQFQRVVDGLHARRPLGELVVAEVGLPGTGSDDEAVVRGSVGVAEQDRVDRLVRQVDVRDLAEHHLGVALLAQDQAGRRRDLALGDDARRHLV